MNTIKIIKRSICCIFIIILLSVSLSVYGNYDDTIPRVIDNADLLNDTEEEYLQSRIDSIIDTYNFDVVILTTDSCGGKSVVEYADDYYDYNGYGYGDNYDGILFLISMEERDWYFSTCGYGITVFTDYGIDYIGNSIVSYLSSGDYYTAFDEFLDYTEEFLTQANEGKPFDTNNYYDYDYDSDYNYSDSDFIIAYGVIFILSLIIALIIVLIMKYKMNTIRMQQNAHLYIKKESLNLKRQIDMFLYSNVTKRLKETNNSSGGGSSTHRSSSGRSHGGGGGKF